MIPFEQQLRELEEKIAQKKVLDQQLPDLYAEQVKLAKRVDELEEYNIYMQTQVERLEGGGIRAFFSGLAFKKDATLKEAQHVKDKLDAAIAEWQEATRRVEECEKAIFELDGSDRLYQKLYRQKESQVRSSDSPVNQEIVQLEERIRDLDPWRQELQEIIKAGDDVIETAQKIDIILDKALEQHKEDMHFVRHGHEKLETIDLARSYSDALSVRCKRFQEAIENARSFEAVTLPNLSAWTRFCDIFFDDIFVERDIRIKIKESQEQLTQLKAATWKELDALHGQYNAVEDEQNRLRKQIRNLINNA